MQTEISPKELKKDIESGKPLTILDVREEWEYASGHIKDSVNISVRELGRVAKLPKDIPVITVCEHGIRSEHARKVLAQLGYSARTLSGGMEAWRSMK